MISSENTERRQLKNGTARKNKKRSRILYQNHLIPIKMKKISLVIEELKKIMKKIMEGVFQLYQLIKNI
mgnify:CR=1 FL=1